MNKLFKRSFAFLLATVMILSMNLSVFAANAYSGSAERTYDSEVEVEYVVSDDVNLSNINLPSEMSGTYYFNASEHKTAHDAVVAVANELDPAGNVGTGGSGSNTYINSIFGLSTVNNYGENSWEGYYWNIELTGIDETGSTVTFESPYYAAGVSLGDYQTFENSYDTVNFPITAMITKITMTYVHDTMTW